MTDNAIPRAMLKGHFKKTTNRALHVERFQMLSHSTVRYAWHVKDWTNLSVDSNMTEKTYKQLWLAVANPLWIFAVVHGAYVFPTTMLTFFTALTLIYIITHLGHLNTDCKCVRVVSNMIKLMAYNRALPFKNTQLDPWVFGQWHNFHIFFKQNPKGFEIKASRCDWGVDL